MIRSGLNVPTPAIPMPDFAVPYAAPKPVQCAVSRCSVVGGDRFGEVTYIRRSSMHTNQYVFQHGFGFSDTHSACNTRLHCSLAVSSRMAQAPAVHTMPRNGANLGASSDSMASEVLKDDLIGREVRLRKLQNWRRCSCREGEWYAVGSTTKVMHGGER